MQIVRALGAAVATVLVAAAVAVLPVSPAQAALCGGSGVNVIVTFGAVGGGTQTGCGSGGDAAAVSNSAGFALSYAARQPGFVCRVKGVPTSDPCVHTSPANAYWGLFWSDGKSATWHYSTLGAGALSVPEGGSVGWAWQDGGARDLPAMAPPVVAAEPKPEPKPKPKPEPKPQPKPAPRPTANPTSPTPTEAAPGQPDPSQGADEGPSASSNETATEPATKKPKPQRTRRTPEATDTAAPQEPTTSTSAAPAEPSDDPTDDETVPLADSSDAGGLPWWIPVGLVVVLAAGAGIAVRRRGLGAG